MVRMDLLRRSISQNHLTLRQVADSLGITTRTLYSRMSRGDFRSDEMERMIMLLHITDPCEVFFDIRTTK